MAEHTTFGSQLRLFRKEADLTLEELAAKVSITLLSLHRYETDQRSPQWDVVVRLAEALGKTPNDFLGSPEKKRTRRPRRRN